VRAGESATTTQELQQKINSGEPVEVLGYEIMPHLGQAIAEPSIASVQPSQASRKLCFGAFFHDATLINFSGSIRRTGNDFRA
jgi:hypothetical protein